MSKAPDRSKKVEIVGAEPISVHELSHGERFAHLAANRSLIVRRSLLATAISSAIPLPVADAYVAGRVRAGLLMKLAETRHVDLPAPSAEILAEANAGS